jgi:histidine triad (HIT) family protein
MPYAPPAYDSSNVFAKILRGEAPCVKLYEDAHAFAFMDIMPRTKGHCLVIPKKAARTILDLPPEDLATYMPAVRLIAAAAMKGLDAEGVAIMQFNEPASGQVVYHMHFHILPAWTGVPLLAPGGPIESAGTLEATAAKIRAALPA